MAQTKIGERVGIIQSMTSTQIELFGYGTYQGDHVCPLGMPNPKLVLDDGRVFWGYTVWWGAEDKIKAKCETRKVVNV